MISVLVLTQAPELADSLSADLARVGIHPLGAVERDELVRMAVEKAPDVVIVEESTPDARPGRPSRIGRNLETECSTRS